MADLFLPVLHSFENNNVFTGSFGQMRFKITPKLVKPDGSKTVDLTVSTLFCEVWYGQFCYEKSEIEATNEFPISEQGREELRLWLTEQIKGA